MFAQQQQPMKHPKASNDTFFSNCKVVQVTLRPTRFNLCCSFVTKNNQTWLFAFCVKPVLISGCNCHNYVYLLVCVAIAALFCCYEARLKLAGDPWLRFLATKRQLQQSCEKTSIANTKYALRKSVKIHALFTRV